MNRACDVLVKLGLAILIIVGTLETSARLAFYLQGHGGAADAWSERAALVGRLAGEARLAVQPTTTAATRQRVVEMAYGARYELHPFFGHTFFRGEPGVNNHGFVTNHAYPYRRTGNEWVVGVFGGSVAMQVADGRRLAAALEQFARARGHSGVIVLPFAVGGWRAPQHFNAFVNYLDDIDLAIFVDGFNEVVQLVPSQLRSYPAWYPPSDIFGGLAVAESSPYEARDRALLALASRWMVDATNLAEAPGARNSLFVHQLWRVAAANYEAFTAELRSRAATPAMSSWAGIDVVRGDSDVERNRARYFRLYESVVRDASDIAHRAGKPFFHFVQPNQHLRGAKPLSRDESTHDITPSWYEIVTPGYERLEQISASLLRDGVDSTFLGRIFVDEPETVYGDACCHFNDRGLDAIVEAIAQRIAASDELARRPALEHGDDTATWLDRSTGLEVDETTEITTGDVGSPLPTRAGSASQLATSSVQH